MRKGVKKFLEIRIFVFKYYHFLSKNSVIYYPSSHTKALFGFIYPCLLFRLKPRPNLFGRATRNKKHDIYETPGLGGDNLDVIHGTV